MQRFQPEIINTTKQVGDLVDLLVFHHELLPLFRSTMYIDLEGVHLCREGSVSIFTLLVDTGVSRRVYLIDVHTLGAQAFNTVGARKTTLKDILQDPAMTKVFFDVRNDSDALFAHFGVALQGVEDVQLMESATRKTTASRKFLTGLSKCIENNFPMNSISGGVASWKLAKEKGERLYKSEHGGSYQVFNQRPIPEDIISYCVGDVQYLPQLRDRFWMSRNIRWQDLVMEESQKRVAMSQRSDYQPQGPKKAMAPWSEEHNALLDAWNYVPPPVSRFNDFGHDYDYDYDYDDDDDDYPINSRDAYNDEDWDLLYSD